MEEIIINSNNKRYLSELSEFKNGLPFGIVNKTKTDVGGTFCAINCNYNYIVVCPFIDLIKSIELDVNNKYNVFGFYGGINKSDLLDYIKNNTIKKIAVTYDSLNRLVDIIGDISSYRLLVDEYHMILEDMDYRENAIDNLMNSVKKFKHYTFLSATPISFNLETNELKSLPHYKVIWDNCSKVNMLKYEVGSVEKVLTNIIRLFLNEGFVLPDINAEMKEVDELYIFINSVNTIEKIIKELNLNVFNTKVCCADNYNNRKKVAKFIQSVSSTNKKINFFTKKCFQGCNLFTNSGLVIVASDGHKNHTLIDVSIAMEQIAGRIRINKHNINSFSNSIVHIYSKSYNVMSDEEFDSYMKEKELECDTILKTQEMIKSYEDGLNMMLKNTDIKDSIISIVDNKFVYNELKKNSLIYKQELRKSYRDGIDIKTDSKFISPKMSDYNLFNSQMLRCTTESFSALLKEYINTKDTKLEKEHPEFKDIVSKCTNEELSTLHFNKLRINKYIDSKSKYIDVLNSLYGEGFYTNKEIKSIMKDGFTNNEIGMPPKATLITNITSFKVKKTKRTINGKCENGYLLYK